MAAKGYTGTSTYDSEDTARIIYYTESKEPPAFRKDLLI